MSIWIILSWVGVALLTTVNIFVFIKLKGASEQMMKMAFPGAKDMNSAMAQMQKMMQGMGGRPGAGGQRGPGGNPLQGMNQQQLNSQMKAAMDMLANMQKGNKR